MNPNVNIVPVIAAGIFDHVSGKEMGQITADQNIGQGPVPYGKLGLLAQP